jgi:hypothetical protein
LVGSGRPKCWKPRGLEQGAGGAAAEAGDAWRVLGAGHEQLVVGGQLGGGGIQGPADQPEGLAGVGLAGQPAGRRGVLAAQHQQGAAGRRWRAAVVAVAVEQA